MKYPIHLPVALLATLTLLLGVGLYAAAQDNALISAEICRPVLERMWAEATTACINKPAGYICNGGDAPAVEPAGAVSNAMTALGALVEVGAVDSLRTLPIVAEIGSAGVVYLRGGESLPYTGLVIGDVSLRDVTPSDFPAWTSFVVETSPEPASCEGAPLNVLVLQSAPGASVRIVVNSVSLLLNGTVIVRTDAGSTIFTAVSGQAAVLAAGHERAFLTGEQVSVPHNVGDVAAVSGAPTVPLPFDPTALQSLPVALLDRPIVLPQPGYVTTHGAVNMRAEPSTNAGVILQVPPGEVLSVLGSSSDSLWYHVRRLNGESGWMLAELLGQNLTTIAAVYDATPMPPQRYGELGTRGRVLAPAGVNLRLGPDVTFPALILLNDGTLVNLLARSPYSPWVKVDAGGSVGWLALITIETQAYIDALPIDFNAPPLPTPTQIPGSFGNAFPDPDLPGN
jgi:uncharacterized protein YraI